MKFALSPYFYGMNLIVFDDPTLVEELYPFTLTRPVGELRVGILTLTEKWENYLGAKASFLTRDYLSVKFPLQAQPDNLLVNGAVCATPALAAAARALKENQALVKTGIVIAARSHKAQVPAGDFDAMEYPGEILCIDQVWKIFFHNGAAIRSDFELVTKNSLSGTIDDPHTIVYGEKIFLAEGASVKAAILNAEGGPIYLGRNAQVQEGAIIRGPFALGEGAQVNMGAKVRGDTTLGPYCKVGGEVSNSVIFGYSNKSHDGFLGNSVVGEWCNLGADTNTSNLKNNYENVKIWNYARGGFKDTGLQFCGLMMGDHSKCGINTMFNTGTVVGVGSNLFGDGFPRTFIPSFAWGGAAGFTTFQLQKMLETATRVMQRRGITMNDNDKAILQRVFTMTRQNRVWEKTDTA